MTGQIRIDSLNLRQAEEWMDFLGAHEHLKSKNELYFMNFTSIDMNQFVFTSLFFVVVRLDKNFSSNFDIIENRLILIIIYRKL